MRNVNVSDADLSAYSGEHLLYELQYLRFSAAQLRRETRGSEMTSVLIDSFVIHLRNLIDFFCTKPGTERKDDVIASDFCPAGWRQDLSDNLRDAKVRASKVLSHLTLDRKKGQVWDVDGLLEEINGIALRFVTQASPSKLSPEITKWLNIVKRPIQGAPLISSNCTVTMAVFSATPATGK